MDVGASDVDGAKEMVGAEVGPPVGSIDPAGVGANEGISEGLISLDGIEEALGDPDGWVEIEGCIDGISDGDSLCAMARKTTKSVKRGENKLTHSK